MADENVDLRFIGEQLACVLQEVDRLRTEQHEMRNELHQARQELAQVHNGQNEIAAEVAALGGNVRDVKETLVILEHDISGIKMRIERLERHAGLVRSVGKTEVEGYDPGI
jgi:chromosome segregation ATPase